jgi:hypothetical protein
MRCNLGKIKKSQNKNYIILIFFLLLDLIIGNLNVKSQVFDNSKIEEELKNSEIKSIKLIKEHLGRDYDAGWHSVYFVDFGSENYGIFKCAEQYELKYKREILAYELSKKFGIGLVPPIVEREISINGEKFAGYMSLYIKPDEETQKLSLDKIFESADEESVINYQTFNLIFGRWDCGRSNLICSSKSKRIFAIDNEWIGTIQISKWGEIPFSLYHKHKTLKNDDINLSEFPFEESQTLTKEKIKEIEEKHKIKISGCSFVFWQNCFWVQYNEMKTCYYPEKLPTNIRQKLEKISMDSLKEVYESLKISYDINSLKSMVLNRDMIFEHFKRI